MLGLEHHLRLLVQVDDCDNCPSGQEICHPANERLTAATGWLCRGIVQCIELDWIAQGIDRAMITSQAAGTLYILNLKIIGTMVRKLLQDARLYPLPPAPVSMSR